MTVPSHATMRHSRPCRICGNCDYIPFAIKNGFHLERCARCRLVQVTDDLSKVDFQSLYGDEFFSETYDWQHDKRGQRKVYDKHHYRLRMIERLRPAKGRILEVGCAFGFFLDAARARGWEPHGIELGTAARVAREELNLPVHNVPLGEAKFDDEFFDAAVMWDVIEHLDDPAADIRRLHRLTKPGGLLIFSTPYVDAYMRKLQGMKWRCFIPPLHVTYFNVPAARSLLERSGYRLVEATVALPQEAVLERLGLIGLLRAIRFSDKLMVIAERI